MFYLATGLRDRGHAVHIACRPGSPCERRCRETGLNVYPLVAHGDLDIFAARRLGRLVDKTAADILHAHTARAHLPCVMARVFSVRKPPCVVHRRVDFSIHKLPLRLSGLKYRWGVDRYIAITQAVKAVMIGDGIPAERIAVIHSCTDAARFENVSRRPGLRAELGVPEDARLIGNVGALVGHKGQRHLLDAAALALKEAPTAFFAILGEGPLRAELEAQAQRLGIAHRLRMPGERQDIPECLAEFDLFCMSSVGEGLGTAVLEAMAAGRPVVTTNAGGLAEVAVDGVNALVVAPGDAPALAGAILRLLHNPAEAAQLADGGRLTVREEFSLDRMVDRTEALYRELLKSRGMQC